MGNKRWIRALALCMAVVCTLTVVAAAELQFDKNGDGKTTVWDLQNVFKNDKDNYSKALSEVFGGRGDELNPKIEDGETVYEIYTEMGLRNMARNAGKGYTFILMDDIDLGGKNWTPVATFKGTFNGNDKTISNFVITETAGTNMGFFGNIQHYETVQSEVSNLHLKDVQIVVDGVDDDENSNAGAQYVGAIAGTNSGKIDGCTAEVIVYDKRKLDDLPKTYYYGTLVGLNTQKTITNADGSKTYEPTGIISGTNALDHTVNITEKSKVTRENTVPFQKPDIKVNSKMALFLSDSVNYTTRTAKTAVGIAGFTNPKGIDQTLLWQDITNSTDLADVALQERRETAAAEMYELCTVEWKPAAKMYNYYNYNSESGSWEAETTIHVAEKGFILEDKGIYRGLPYAHSITSMERFEDYVGHYTGEKELWSPNAYYYNSKATAALFTRDDGSQREDQDQTGWGMHIGSDCIAQTASAWRTISAVTKDTEGWAKLVITGESFSCKKHMDWYGFQAVNDLVFDDPADLDGDKDADSVDLRLYLEEYYKTNKDRYLDALAMTSKADVLIGYAKSGAGHALMAISDAVVVRTWEGKVDKNRSYIVTAEQGGAKEDSDGIDRYSYYNSSKLTTEWHSTCCVDRRSTFAALLHDGNVTGTTSWMYFPITCDVLRNPDSAAANVTINMDAAGNVTSNFHIVSTTVNGETVYPNMVENMQAVKDTDTGEITKYGYRSNAVKVNLASVHKDVAADQDVVVVLANGDTYTGKYGTAGLTKVSQ